MDRKAYMDEVFGKSSPKSIEDVDATDLKKHRRFVTILRRNGGSAKKNDITKQCPMSHTDAEAIAKMLSSEGLLVVETLATAGRPATVYRLVTP